MFLRVIPILLPFRHQLLCLTVSHPGSTFGRNKQPNAYHQWTKSIVFDYPHRNCNHTWVYPLCSPTTGAFSSYENLETSRSVILLNSLSDISGSLRRSLSDITNQRTTPSDVWQSPQHGRTTP